MPRAENNGRPQAREWLICGFWLVAAWLASGCSPASPKVVPVSGRVTLAGEPLAGAVVTFQPELDATAAEVGSVGHTNAEGRYELRLVDPDVPGAVAGRHIVTISTATIAAGNDAAVSRGQRTAKRWRDGSQYYMVPAGGTDRADFEVN